LKGMERCILCRTKQRTIARGGMGKWQSSIL
jgi:hypothetical protein